MQCLGGAEQCARMYVTAPATVIYVSFTGGGVLVEVEGEGGGVLQRGHAAYPGNEVIVACRDLRRLSRFPPSTFPGTGPAPSQHHPSTAAR